MLANNTTGSALGSGMATVTNLGVLGGNGFVAAATVNNGGTISPGASATGLANLTVTSLTFGEGATYLWQIGAAAGTAGVNWDLITVESWSDLASSLNPVTIKVDSKGVTPTGWNPATARDWVILQPSSNYGFNASNFALDTTAFSGSVQGIFSLYADASGAVHLAYTPAADIVINVPSGTQSQADAGYSTLTGARGVVKIGNGELVVDNPLNDYQGSTKVLAGTLSISVDAANGLGALGTSSTATYLGNTTGNSNATFNINMNGVMMSRDLVVQAGSSGVKTIGTTLTSGAASYQGDITLQDSAVLSAASGSSIAFGGDFSGNGGVTLNGPGSFTLGGIGTYAGATTVNTPVLALNGPAFGTNTVTFATAMALDNTSGSDITLSSCPQNWNADFEFIGSAGLNLGSGPVTMSGSRSVTVDAGTLVVGGPIAGNGGLTKLGAGALVLDGSTSSTYTGGTTNSAGVLVVNGTATLGDGTGTLVAGRRQPALHRVAYGHPAGQPGADDRRYHHLWHQPDRANLSALLRDVYRPCRQHAQDRQQGLDQHRLRACACKAPGTLTGPSSWATPAFDRRGHDQPTSVLQRRQHARADRQRAYLRSGLGSPRECHPQHWRLDHLHRRKTPSPGRRT